MLRCENKPFQYLLLQSTCTTCTLKRKKEKILSMCSLFVVTTTKIKIVYDFFWLELKFLIPIQFSVRTTNAMNQNAFNWKANDEIVIVMSLCIMLWTMSTSPEEIDVCCEWLIENHPVLKDTEWTYFVRWIKHYCKMLFNQCQFRTLRKISGCFWPL